MISKEEIEIDHTKDSFCVRIPLITEQELKRIDDNLDSITNELTKQIIHDKDLALAQHIIQKQKDRINELEQENNKQNKMIDEMAEEIDAEILDKIDWCKLYNKGICGYDDTCLKCLKQYFEKKVEEK